MAQDSQTPRDWQELMEVTRDEQIKVERVWIPDKDIYVEGSFELPPLARLNLDDQVFVAAFVRCHGSIKEMEKIFGVSYPTIKTTLNRIANSLKYDDPNKTSSQTIILDRLQRGEISVQDAIRELEELND